MGEIFPEVLVIGAGVSGLTTAIGLAEAGLRVRVRSEATPAHSTSAAAGAFWCPYLVSHPDSGLWGRQTLDVLVALAAGERAGVRMVTGTEAARYETDPPDWTAALGEVRRCRAAELPAGFVTGWRYRVPVLDMPVYLGYLVARLRDAGGAIEPGRVASLDEALTRAAIVVNCAGSGARRLVPDDRMTPIRGQLAVVANPGLHEFFTEFSDEDEELLTYLLPQGAHVVLGGTAEPGRDEPRCDEADLAAILRRCEAIEPRLRGARMIGSRVGIRPSRPEVRVEHVPVGGRHVVHNYGHGGAGVSLSWGCAYRVRDIVLGLTAA